MLKLRLQYFGHLIWRANSLEKTLMLGKIEGKRRRRWQRMTWLDGITDSMDMSLSDFQQIVKDREAWHAAVDAVAKNQTRLSDWTPNNHSKGPVLKEKGENEESTKSTEVKRYTIGGNSPKWYGNKCSLGNWRQFWCIRADRLHELMTLKSSEQQPKGQGKHPVPGKGFTEGSWDHGQWHTSCVTHRLSSSVGLSAFSVNVALSHPGLYYPKQQAWAWETLKFIQFCPWIFPMRKLRPRELRGLPVTHRDGSGTSVGWSPQAKGTPSLLHCFLSVHEEQLWKSYFCRQKWSHYDKKERNGGFNSEWSHRLIDVLTPT